MQLRRIAEIFGISADYLLGINTDESISKDAMFARKIINLYKEMY